jgi:hypothetical protein
LCCSCPNGVLADKPDGCYPLCFSMVSGLSSFLIAQNGDKAVCVANLQQYINEVKFS